MNTIATFSPNSTVPNDPWCNALGYVASSTQSLGMYMATELGFPTLGGGTWFTGKVLTAIDDSFCRQKSLQNVWQGQLPLIMSDVTQLAISWLHSAFFAKLQDTMHAQHPDLAQEHSSSLSLQRTIQNTKIGLASAQENPRLTAGTENEQKTLNQIIKNHEKTIEKLTKKFDACTQKIAEYKGAMPTYFKGMEGLLSALATGAHAAAAYVRAQVYEGVKEHNYQDLYQGNALIASFMNHSIANATDTAAALIGATAELQGKLGLLLAGFDNLMAIFQKGFLEAYPLVRRTYDPMKQLSREAVFVFQSEITPALAALTGLPFYAIDESTKKQKLVELVGSENRFSSLLSFLIYLKQGDQLPSEIAFNGFVVQQAASNLKNNLLSMISALNTFMRDFSTYLRELNNKNFDTAEPLLIKAKTAFKEMENSKLQMQQALEAFIKA